MEKFKKEEIRNIMNSEIKSFSEQLISDYSINGKKAENILNKKNNIFYRDLSHEISINSALMRSFDSSFGNRIEDIAKKVAENVGKFKVSKGVSGTLSTETINQIATILDGYKNKKQVSLGDLLKIQKSVENSSGGEKSHNSDYLLEKIDKKGVTNFTLVELKIGGDLDNKKARSEKAAILEQYAMLYSANQDKVKKGKVKIKIYFATAYNKDSYDAGKESWNQGSVENFFSSEELLIGKDFWNFICDDKDGWEIIKEEYKNSCHHIDKSLQEVKENWLEWLKN